MTTTIVEASLAEIAPIVADAALRGAMLLAVAAGATLLLRRAAAATRHLVWAAATTGLLVLPVLMAVVPGIGVLPSVEQASSWARPADPGRVAEQPTSSEGPASVAVAADPVGPATSSGRPALEQGSVATGAGQAVDAARPMPAPTADISAAPSRMSPASLLGLLWLAGAAVLLLPVASGWLAVMRLGPQLHPVVDSRVRDAAAAAATRIGLRRPVRLRTGRPASMPMAIGIVRPTVVLPPESATWPARRLEAVLLHELAHVARRDCLTQLVGQLARALHWFNPLAWKAERRLRVEREHACDDVALSHGAGASEYADELLELARTYRTPGVTALAAVAMARPSHLEGRLLAVLDGKRSRGGPGRRGAASAVGGGTVLTLILAAAAPAAVPPEPAEPVTATSPDREVAPAILISQEATCVAQPEGWQQSQQNVNDDRTTIRMSRPDCEVEIRMEGDVEFDAVEPAVVQLTRGAFLRIEEDTDRLDRWLEITAGAGGTPSYEYREDGRQAEFDAEARGWYQAVVVQLFRRFGFAAEARVRAILASDGVDGVLGEMDLLESDYVRAKYFQELVQQSQLTEDQYQRVLRLAAERVESDHYTAEILQGVAEHQEVTVRLLDDYLAAALRIDSDHYTTETLQRVIDGGRLSAPQVAQVLRAAGDMESDHYRSQMLVGVADQYALEPAFRSAYLEATAAMDSDHYRSEVLGRLLRRNDLSDDEMADVISASRMLESDHYRSEILKQTAALGLDRAALQRSFFEAAADLDSDHYYGEAMAVLVERDGIEPALLVEMIDHARLNLDSDHYLSELLIGTIRRHPMTGELREAVLRATEEMESSHNRGQVADALLRKERGG